MTLITHAHFDRLWGISDAKNASLLFPSADFVASEIKGCFLEHSRPGRHTAPCAKAADCLDVLGLVAIASSNPRSTTIDSAQSAGALRRAERPRSKVGIHGLRASIATGAYEMAPRVKSTIDNVYVALTGVEHVIRPPRAPDDLGREALLELGCGPRGIRSALPTSRLGATNR
jgi:hypothetical protein